MNFMSYTLASSLLILSMILSLPLTYGQLVPAPFIFGDSAVDVGNNNNLWTIVKANFPPYGRDFVNKTSTGRFSNGKLSTDFIAERHLFNSYQPAYLGREARGRNLLIGANFASAASGYYDATADIFLPIPLSKQLQNYKENQEKVVKLVRDANASTIFSGGIHIISAGSSDFVQNYYINPLLNNARTPEQFSDFLLQNMSSLLRICTFASAASGLYDETAVKYCKHFPIQFNAIPLSKQLDNYKGYQEKVMELVGTDNASLIFSRGIHLISAGNSDFLQNYYINPLLNIAQTQEQFSNVLMQKFANLVEDLYGLGARKIGVTTLAPIGCLPTAITLFGLGQNECVERLNHDALVFNEKLNATSELMKNRFTDLVLVVFDIYQPLFNIISNPIEHGFSEVRRGCCGTGLFETSFLCTSLAVGTCTNASQYIFWDDFHPSEAANQVLANDMIPAGLTFVP